MSVADWIQTIILLVAIVGVWMALKKDKKTDTDADLKNAVEHEKRHSNAENNIKEIEKSLIRVEAKLDKLNDKIESFFTNRK